MQRVVGGASIPRLCGDDCATEREMAYALGRDEERARVVAWLRDAGPTAARCAAIFERGEHWEDHECGRPEAEATDAG